MSFPGGAIGTSINSLGQDFMSISHNLSNLDTVGFKKKTTSFGRELNKLLNNPNEPTTQGTILMEDFIDFSQGIIKQTGRTLDLALEGGGFFVIETQEGPRFTRNGVFQVNAQSGQLVDMNGRLVAGEQGPIVIPPGTAEAQISVAPDGTVSAGEVAVGQIKIVDFGTDNPNLKPLGDCYYAANEDMEQRLTFQRENVRAGDTKILQGHVEKSNVTPMTEAVNMIQIMRQYEMNIKYLTKRKEIHKSMIDVAKSG